MHWTVRGKRNPKLTEDALEFVQCLMNADVEHIAIENPVGAISTRIRKPNCIIHPWQFGHAESKTTCLWLKNLPHLKPTKIIPKPANGKWENQTPSGQNKLTPSPNRWKERSKTYRGIAEAMAIQWTEYLSNTPQIVPHASFAENLFATYTTNITPTALALNQTTLKILDT
jgi:hypothetical protein